MIRYRTQSTAPHLVIELRDTLSGSEVRGQLRDLPDALATLPKKCVVMVMYPEVGLVKSEAVGPLFYFVTHIFESQPGLCVFVDGGQSPHPGLRAFIEKIGLEDQVLFVETEADAERHIQRYLQAQR